MKSKLLILLASAAMILTGCGGTKCNKNLGDDLLPTPITDSLKFAQADSLEGKKFASTSEDANSYDHYGYVTLRSCTDGDTANFVQSGYVDESNKPITIKTRFLGVNTPESTAKVEPWGKKASLFTKHILEEAQAKADEESKQQNKTVYNIALISDPAVTGVKDSSGNRWLAFVWYRKSSADKWRLLNLELVEQAYSKNQYFLDSKVCDYQKAFQKAHDLGEKCGYRVFGQEDPGFDYTTQTYEYSLWGIKEHYDDIGISESGGSGVQLIVTALVVGLQGDNLYLRDLFIDNEQYEKEGDNARLAGCYGYAGFGSALASTLQNASIAYGMDGTGVGLILRFYSRATIYSGNVQLSDIQAGTTGKKGMKILTADNFASYASSFTWAKKYHDNGTVTYEDVAKSIEPVALPANQISTKNGTEDCKYPDLLPYAGQWATVDLTIRSVTSQDDDDKDEQNSVMKLPTRDSNKYWRNDTPNSESYTVYAKFQGKDGTVYCNIRVDTSLSPTYTKGSWGTSDRFDVDSPASPVGTTWRVTGYLVRYFEGFQMQLGNNYSQYNYVQKITNA